MASVRRPYLFISIGGSDGALQMFFIYKHETPMEF